MENYVDAKFRIIRNQTEDDAFIYWNDDPVITEKLSQLPLKSQRYPFAETHEPGTQAYTEDGALTIDTPEEKLTMETDELSLHGRHNLSKSDETGKGCIYILDDINVSKKKIMSAVTDSDNAIYYDVKNKPGISNLLTIYSILSGESIDALVERYQGVGYGQFKKDLAEVVGNELQKIHDKYNEINQGNYIDTILNEGADKARYMARKKLAKVERKIGITIKK